MSEVRKHMIFHGRVQGVGFRYTAKYLARSMNLTGWVKNEYDGTVVMEVQGRETLIFELMKGLNRNQFIQINWIDTEEMEPELFAGKPGFNCALPSIHGVPPFVLLSRTGIYKRYNGRLPAAEK